MGVPTSQLPVMPVPGVYTDQIPPAAPTDFVTGVPVFLGYGGTGTSTVSQPQAFTRWTEFQKTIGSQAGVDPLLIAAVQGFFACGGAQCLVVLLGGVAAWTPALLSLVDVDGFDLVCAPSLGGEAAATKVVGVQAQILQFCDDRRAFADGSGAQGRVPDCFAILDGPRDPTSAAALPAAIRTALGGAPVDVLRSGALYHPWVRVGTDAFIPPCGHVAGIVSATDLASGPYIAPANKVLSGVVELAVRLTDADQASLAGVNCLRVFPGRGIRVWGARTLLAWAKQPSDTPHVFVNVQRLYVTLARRMQVVMQWAVFEPHDLSLWNRVTRQLTAYLESLFLGGALAGRTVDEAFFVKCDAENNPPASRALGNLVVDVGIAPLVPSEFVVVRLTQSAQGTTSVQTV